MKDLSKNAMLRITRIGRGLTLEETARKVFLSPSFILMMEQGKRNVPDEVESILNFDEGTKWYITIATALSEGTKEATEALGILNRVIGIK